MRPGCYGWGALKPGQPTTHASQSTLLAAKQSPGTGGQGASMGETGIAIISGHSLAAQHSVVYRRVGCLVVLHGLEGGLGIRSAIVVCLGISHGLGGGLGISHGLGGGLGIRSAFVVCLGISHGVQRGAVLGFVRRNLCCRVRNWLSSGPVMLNRTLFYSSFTSCESLSLNAVSTNRATTCNCAERQLNAVSRNQTTA
eukprot:1137170-Pelagomonas_calceolata.AAC.7